MKINRSLRTHSILFSFIFAPSIINIKSDQDKDFDFDWDQDESPGIPGALTSNVYSLKRF